VRRFLAGIKEYWSARPFIWKEGDEVEGGEVHLPTCGKVLFIAPHPDDAESVAITLRLLMGSGCEISLAVISLSPSGVEDEYARRWSGDTFLSLQGKKREIRRREQISSAAILGLTQDQLVFLGLEEDSTLDSRQNRSLLKNHLQSMVPDIVILPIGKDPNQTHSWTHQVFREGAQELVSQIQKPLVALYNEDPKTLEIRKDLFVLFGEESARWKRVLLRTHDSQQQRNIHLRGIGFDERILGRNYWSGKHLSAASPEAPYAEVFEIELFDFPPIPDSI
jgi:LmbE family N-acetylglucosaminyl deacetylase